MGNKENNKGLLKVKRIFSNDAIRSSLEKKTERFVTFDGNDNQNLFTCSDKDQNRVDTKSSYNGRETNTVKISFGRTDGNRLDVRCSPDKKVPSIIDVSRRKRVESHSRDFNIVSGTVLDSNRSGYRGDSRYLEGGMTSRSRASKSGAFGGNMREIMSPLIKLDSLETEK